MDKLEVVYVSKFPGSSTVHYPGCEEDPYRCFQYDVLEVFYYDAEKNEYNYEPEDIRRNGIKIAEISGTFVFGNLISERGFDFYESCDAVSGDLEYMASALTEMYGPVDRENPPNIFWLANINMESNFASDDKLKAEILSKLPQVLATHNKVFPDMITFYSVPLPYEEPAYIKERNLAGEAKFAAKVEEVIAISYDGKDPSEVPAAEPLDPAQANHVLGRRNKDEDYPEEAKNREEWNFFENIGFKLI